MRSDAIKLSNIRTQLEALAGAQWLLSVDGNGTFLEAKASNGEIYKIATFHDGALSEEIEFLAASLKNMGFMLGLVDRAIASARKMQTQQDSGQGNKQSKDFAAEAAMKCEEPAFKVFLEERHQLERPLTTERVAIKLRSLLRITSRKELNDNADAAERWRSLRADYEAWKRGAGR